MEPKLLHTSQGAYLQLACLPCNESVLPYTMKHWQEFSLVVCYEIDGKGILVDFILMVGRDISHPIVVSLVPGAV